MIGNSNSDPAAQMQLSLLTLPSDNEKVLPKQGVQASLPRPFLNVPRSHGRQGAAGLPLRVKPGRQTQSSGKVLLSVRVEVLPGQAWQSSVEKLVLKEPTAQLVQARLSSGA